MTCLYDELQEITMKAQQDRVALHDAWVEEQWPKIRKQLFAAALLGNTGCHVSTKSFFLAPQVGFARAQAICRRAEKEGLRHPEFVNSVRVFLSWEGEKAAPKHNPVTGEVPF